MEAERDPNRVTTLIGVDKNDGETPVNVAVKSATGAVIVEVG